MPIHRITVIIDCVGTIDVVNKSITIIVHTITCNFILVDPHLVPEILMGIANSGVANRYNCGLVSRG